MKQVSLLKVIIPLAILMLLGTGIIVATKLSQKSQDLQSHAATDQIAHTNIVFKTTDPIQVGNEIQVNVMLDTSNDPDFTITGIDLILPFPDANVAVPTKIEATKTFNTVTRKEINTKDKTIYFSASVNNLKGIKNVLGDTSEATASTSQNNTNSSPIPIPTTKPPFDSINGVSGQVNIASITFKIIGGGELNLTPTFTSASSTTDTNIIGFEKDKPAATQTPRERLLVKPEPTILKATIAPEGTGKPRPSLIPCIPRPACADGITGPNGTVTYCDPEPGVIYCQPTKPTSTPRPVKGCDTIRCKEGFVCVEEQVQCITTPCNPIATCKPKLPTPSPKPRCPSVTTPANFCSDGIVIAGKMVNGCQQAPTCKTSTVTADVSITHGSSASIPVSLYIATLDALSSEYVDTQITDGSGKTTFNVTTIAKKYAKQPVYLYYVTPNYFPVRTQNGVLDVSDPTLPSLSITNKVNFSIAGDVYTAPEADLPDGVINTFDALQVISSIGQKTTIGDINHDGIVNTVDLSLLLKNMGKVSPITVPPRSGANFNPFTNLPQLESAPSPKPKEGTQILIPRPTPNTYNTIGDPIQ